MKIVGWITTTVVSLVLANIWRGWVLVILWKWFVFGSLTAVAISIPQAIGISTIAGYLTGRAAPSKTKKEDKKPFADEMIDGCVQAFFVPGFALFFGWIVHFFL